MRIPRSEVERIEAAVRAAAAAHDPPLQMTVCGSYRRGRASSGDVDCLLCHPSYREANLSDAAVPDWLNTLVAALRHAGFVTETLALGRKKCAAVCRLPEAPVATTARASSDGGAADDSADGGRGTAPSSGDAPPASAALRVPSWTEVQARRANRLGTRPPMDMFASWRAGKAGEASPSPSPSADVSASAAAAAPAAAPAGESSSVLLGGYDGAQMGREGDDGCRRYRRLDLRLVPYDSYHAAMLYFTGSDEHNKLMRNVAIEKGYKLSEYGLYRVLSSPTKRATAATTSTSATEVKLAERPEAVESEADIFKLLGMPYKTPQERDI